MYNANQEEQAILKFWDQDKTFEKSVNERPEDKPYVFYDGPPFATGLPHYGHILASVIKDVVPRYFTMKGFRVRRRWGWDCHGLPIESLVEKELNISGKKDIEEKFGIEKFNATCRSKVLMYAAEWKKMVMRIGRWVEFDNSYKTMDATYMESVWWALKTIWDKGLIYEGRRVLMYCPHCETPVSKAEIAMDNSYQDITEEAVTVKFKVESGKGKELGLPENTFILAWTTTPWTLPGNVALAVGEKILYSVVELNDENLIVADELVEKMFYGKAFKKIKFIPGNSLVGLKYEPLFEMPAMRQAPSKKVYEVVPADFVTTSEGTGVVHTAVVYGEEDYNLGLKVGLPVVPMLNEKGEYNEVAPAWLQGKYIKAAEKEIKTDLEKRGLLFAKNQNTHSYPHCWRCDTPLIYNAISAWFINIQKVKKRLIELNEKINWYPEHLKHGRFLNILETAPDWNISRNRYWATPLPFWKHVRNTKTTKDTKDECQNVVCIGSVDELRAKGDRPITKIIFVRHGESEKNVQDIQSSTIDKWPLTKQGEKGVTALAKIIKDKIDVIISSPVLRAKQTAEIIQKQIKSPLVFDNLLEEYHYGKWEDLSLAERQSDKYYQSYKKITNLAEKYETRLGETGETRREITARVGEFLKKLTNEYEGKTVMVVSHSGINGGFKMNLDGCTMEEFFASEKMPYDEVQTFYIDENGKELDLHKHNIDKIKLKCDKCGGKMDRIPEVIDCWVESGSMPFAEWHYPFENQETFKKRFPGQYIAEYINQTRAWFYYMHAMAGLLFDSNSFTNCVTTGVILNEKGEKMSKSKRNFPDPWEIIEKYGVDTLRYYLMTGVVMEADDLCFNEREIRELYNKVINILWNVVEFYLMYANATVIPSEPRRGDPLRQSVSPPCRSNGEAGEASEESGSSVGDTRFLTPANGGFEMTISKPTHVLDQWILAKLQVLVKEETEQMDKYNTVKAGRPIKDFIDELSTWYVRRSRDRFKGVSTVETLRATSLQVDKQAAIATLREVLLTLSKLMAPFTPFIAEKIWQAVNGGRGVLQYAPTVGAIHELPLQPVVSVHLQPWPEINKKLLNEKVLEEMSAVRKIVELGLAARAEAKIKVRQPLAQLAISNKQLTTELKQIVCDELNVKEVIAEEKSGADWVIKEDGGIKVVLNVTLTPELKKEGLLREIIRAINQMRKEQKLTVQDKVAVYYDSASAEVEAVFTDYAAELKQSVLAEELIKKSLTGAKEVILDGLALKLTVEKKGA